jgi:hypothetical protein
VTRQCGACDICCTVAQVEGVGFRKPAWQACKYSCDGCVLYNRDERPTICSQFQCAWLRGAGLEQDRPDNSGIMVSVNNLNGGNWIFAIETKANALLGSGKNIVLDAAAKINLPVIVVDFNSRPPKDFGNRVIVKNSLLKRSTSIMGDFVAYLDDYEEFGLYLLKIQ